MRTNNIQEIFEFLRGKENTVIIGLTGSLGSGCSTAANIFEKITKDFLELDNCMIHSYTNVISFDRLEEYRFKIIKNFYKEIKNLKVQIVKVSKILEYLFSFFLEKESKELQNFKNFLSDSLLKEELNKQEIKPSESDKNLAPIMEVIEVVINIKNLEQIDNFSSKFEAILKDYPTLLGFSDEFKRKRLLQEFGRFLRKNGLSTLNSIPPIFTIAKIIDNIIEIFRNIDRNNKIIFVIDSLRNPFEIEYFRNKYGQFYLFSILANKEERRKRLKNFGFSNNDITNVQEIENKEPKDANELYEQNINFCIIKGDVFINNNGSIDLLKYQLGKYLALILKPGLVTPSKDELYMQLAFTAKNMSGCISRQVGAVVVGKDGYIRGIGWNDPPEKFIPCLYRTLRDLFNNPLPEMFSEYERSNDFKEIVKEYKIGDKEYPYWFPFCFKDIENFKNFRKNLIDCSNKIYKVLKDSKELDDETVENLNKNIENILMQTCKYRDPSRERALHAEENAFLQASKIGGAPVTGGSLYTTSFPCQLCSKKSRQLFISRIIYIEDYPDISYPHTLKGGEKETQPKVEMFTGAIGQAYFKLYTPYIAIKDEIKLLLSESS